jgi:hypothetical protein
MSNTFMKRVMKRTYLAILIFASLCDVESLESIRKLESVGNKGLQVDESTGDQRNGHWVIARSVSVGMGYSKSVG